MSTLSLKQVLFQDELRSKPVRENFDDIQSESNSKDARITILEAGIDSDSEVLAARESAASLKANLLNIREQISPNGYQAVGFRVVENVPDMKVKVELGNGFVNGSGIVLLTDQTSGAITAAASGKHRIDAVVIDASATVTVKTGIEVLASETSEIPTISASEMLLAHFEISDTTTSIIQESIVDDRNVLSLESNRGIHITNQTQFEWFFGTGTETVAGTTSGGWNYTVTTGLIKVTIPENTKIHLHPCQVGGTTTSYNGKRAYILKAQLELSTGITILGDGYNSTVVVKDDDSSMEDDIKFISTYKAQTTVSGVSTNDFTVSDSSSFVVGDMVHHSQDNAFYEITSIPDATSIVIYRTITGAASGSLSSMITDINMDNWSFDGRGGVDGLGGSIDGFGKNGGAFNIPFLGNSKLNLKIINHWCRQNGGFTPVFPHGGGVFGDKKSSYLEILNITNCRVNGEAGDGVYGGGISGILHSRIKVNKCYSYHPTLEDYGTGHGGGAYECDYSNIEATDCQAHNGGGALDCDYSIITAYNCTANFDGGGAYECDYSAITAYNCTAGTGDIADSCTNSNSIWGNTGTITSSSLGGVRLVADDASGSGYTTPTITGGFTTAIS